MKGILKRLTALFLAMAIFVPCAYAESEVKNTLSLSEAIALARENSREVESAEYEVKSSGYAVESASITKYDYGKMPSVSVDVLYVKRGYYLEAANMSLKLAKLKKEQMNEKIAYTVTENYYNAQLATKLLAIADNTYNLALSNKQVVDKYFELGMVSELEVKNAELALKSASYTKDSYIRNEKIAKMNLNISLGVPTDTEYVLTDSITVPTVNVDLENDILGALSKRYDLIAAEENKKLSDLYFEITKKYYTDTTSAYHSAYSKKLTAENTYENAVNQIDLYIRTLYNGMLSASTTVEIAEGKLEIEKTEFDAAKLKFEMGMITNTELTTALSDMQKAENELEQAKLSELLAIKKYGYEITLGL